MSSLLHHFLVDRSTLVVNQTGRHLKPVCYTYIIDHLEVVVVEILQLAQLFVSSRLRSVVDLINNAGVDDSITVSPYHLCISISFRIVRHAEWGSKVELLDFEIITQAWCESEVSMSIPSVLHADFHFIRQTPTLTIAQIQRVEERRRLDTCTSSIQAHAADELIANHINSPFLPFAALDIILTYTVCFRPHRMVMGVDLILQFTKRCGAQGVHHLSVSLNVDGVSYLLWSIVGCYEASINTIANKSQMCLGRAPLR